MNRWTDEYIHLDKIPILYTNLFENTFLDDHIHVVDPMHLDKPFLFNSKDDNQFPRFLMFGIPPLTLPFWYFFWLVTEIIPTKCQIDKCILPILSKYSSKHELYTSILARAWFLNKLFLLSNCSDSLIIYYDLQGIGHR